MFRSMHQFQKKSFSMFVIAYTPGSVIIQGRVQMKKGK